MSSTATATVPVPRSLKSATKYTEERQYLTTLRLRRHSRLPDLINDEDLQSLFATILEKLKRNALRGDVESLTQSMFDYLSKFYDDPSLKSFIGSFEQITQGGFSVVYVANKKGTEIPLFIVKKKIARSLSSESFIHEAYVGTRVINQLRNYTPGFIHTYGIFQCNNAPIREFCKGADSSTSYMFLERIPGNRTLYDYFQYDKPNVEAFTNLILQIQSALNIAYKKYGFTHYDLHEGNVLVQELNEPVEIPIYYNQHIYWIRTSTLFRIIDYGTATVTVDEEQHWFEIDSIETRSYACPFADFVTLFINMYRVLADDGELYQRMEAIYAYSGRSLPQDLELSKNKEAKNAEIVRNGYLVPTERYRHITCDDMLGWIMAELPIMDLLIDPEEVTNPAACDIVTSYPCRTLEELENVLVRQRVS